jgi:hypothetical protein
MSECSVLSTANSACSGMNETPSPCIFYVFMYSVALLFRHWHDLATKKRKEAQKQIPITSFLKK